MKENKIYGLNACIMFAKKRPQRIRRAYFNSKTSSQFSILMKEMASQKRVYRIVDDKDLEKLTQSQHSEGVCFVVDLPRIGSFKDYVSKNKKDKVKIFALEKVGNPQNLGAIVRSCAHFGIDAIIHNQAKLFQSGACFRTAQGGMEFVEILQLESWQKLFLDAKNFKFKTYSTSSHEGKNLFEMNFSDRSLIFFGEESSGLSGDIIDNCHEKIQIVGSKNMESLNVSVAASIVAAKLF